MFNPCDAMLCFYLLMGQEYSVNKNIQFDKPEPWYSHKELITNDNVFDMSELYKLIENEPQ
jgi:hypothetical protein